MTEPEPDEPIDRSLIDEARPAMGPTPEQRARLKRAVLAAAVGSAAAGTAALGAGTSASATSAAGLGLGAKVAIAVFALAALGGGAWLATSAAPGMEPVTDSPAPPEPEPERDVEPPPEPTPVPPPEVEPEAAPEPAPTPEVAPEPEVEPRVEPAPRPRPPEPDFSAIERETELLREAHAASRRGDPRAALALLEQHATQFPRGALATERRTLHILALCEAGEERRARDEARDFLASGPPAGLAARVARSCAGAESAPPQGTPPQ